MMYSNRISRLIPILLGAAFVFACGSNAKRIEEPGPVVSGVRTETVHIEATPTLYRAAGVVRSVNTAVLAAQLAGAVREIHVQAGDRVRRGQLLAVLDDRTAQAQVQGAEAGVEEAAQGEAEIEQALTAAAAERAYAEATFNRYKNLLAKNSLSRQEYDGAEAHYQAALANERAIAAKKQQILARQRQARSQQESAKTYLSYARIVSPMDGIVTAKSVDAGTVVMPGAPLLTVEDTSRYRLEVSVPEAYLANIKNQAAVPVSTEEGQFEGRVAEVVPAADSTSHTFVTKIDLPHDSKCRSGEYGQASISVGEAKSLAVPASAVVEHGELEGVFVVNTDGSVEYRLVKTGRSFGKRVEILSGLAASERVAVTQTDRLRDGARVEAQ